MKILRRIRLKFWRKMAEFRHRKYTPKYAKMLGVRVADSAAFTGVPDFCTEPWLISIGERCLITQNVRFMTHDGSVSVVRSMGGKYKDIMKFGEIILEDGAFCRCKRYDYAECPHRHRQYHCSLQLCDQGCARRRSVGRRACQKDLHGAGICG